MKGVFTAPEAGSFIFYTVADDTGQLNGTYQLVSTGCRVVALVAQVPASPASSGKSYRNVTRTGAHC